MDEKISSDSVAGLCVGGGKIGVKRRDFWVSFGWGRGYWGLRGNWESFLEKVLYDLREIL